MGHISGHDTHHYSSIIESCRFEASKLRQAKFQHILREGNSLADKVAFYASNCNSFVILDNMPCVLSIPFLADCLGISTPRRMGVG